MFDNDDKFKRSPIKQVRTAVKLHYTITPIGGAKDLATWKAQQKVDEDKWQVSQSAKRFERRANAIAVVGGDKAAMVAPVEEQKETRYLDSKRAVPDARKDEYLPYQPVIIKKSFIDKVTSWISQALFN